MNPEVLGLKGTFDRIKSANGPAQLLTYAFWGVLIAGMFWDVCDDCIPNWLLAVWGCVSFAVLPATMWCRKVTLKNLLVLDMLVSAVILVIYVMHEPHYTTITYKVNQSGVWNEPPIHDLGVSDFFNIAALMWMIAHSAYLANLTQRQQLERERMIIRSQK